MDALNKISPVDKYNQKVMSQAFASRHLCRPSQSVSFYQDEMERLPQAQGDTAQKIADAIKEFLTSRDVRLEFYLDENTGDIMARIIQNKSGRIIREIPGRVILGEIGTIDVTV